MVNLVDLARASIELQLASLANHKEIFMLLALLIPRKSFVTLEVFDVYMQPLIEELLHF